MNIAIRASVLGLLAAAGPALGQCSATDNMVAIAAINGDNLVVDHVMDNDAELLYYIDETGTKVVLFYDGVTAHEMTDFDVGDDGSVWMDDGVIYSVATCDKDNGAAS